MKNDYIDFFVNLHLRAIKYYVIIIKSYKYY